MDSSSTASDNSIEDINPNCTAPKMKTTKTIKTIHPRITRQQQHQENGRNDIVQRNIEIIEF